MNDVAIKLLKPETVGSESSVRKFLAEIDVLRACRDPHIVAFYGGWAQKVRDMPHAWLKQSRRLGAAPWQHIHTASGMLLGQLQSDSGPLLCYFNCHPGALAHQHQAPCSARSYLGHW